MIVTREDESLVMVTQPDHARFSAEIVSLWRADGLPDHPRRDDLLFAVREHDNGWREADAAPRVDPETGRPHDFLSIPREVRFEIWRLGTRRFAREHPYPALLITRHALALHQAHQGDEEWREFLDELAALFAELVEASGARAEDLAADYRYLDLADVLSLMVSNRWTAPLERRGTRARLAGQRLELAPFPLAGTTTFRIPCRRIPDRRYLGDADLGGELAAARWQELAVQVAPADPCGGAGC